MNIKKLTSFMLSLASASAFAGGVGAEPPKNLLLFEAGFSYSHAFYKDNIRTAESFNNTTPNGVSINGDDFYPDDFFGGYIGASYYMPHWLLNTRLDMYEKESKLNATHGSDIHLAPARLSFTVDKVFGNINYLSYGIGAGAVIETLNEGAFFDRTVDGDAPFSETLSKTRIDPTVEGFAMYRVSDNLRLKFNLAYQIPAHSDISNGDLNLNLGINYAVAV